jgi:hypothetical protein
MERSGAATAVILVRSEVLAGVAVPPPETVAVLVTLAEALAATLTVSMIGGWLAPGARTSLRVHVTVAPTVQVQPEPVAAVAVSPAGKVSLTVTVPVVDPAEGAFDTSML